MVVVTTRHTAWNARNSWTFEVPLCEVVRFRDDHFEADLYVLVADLLRTGEQPGVPSEVGDVLPGALR